jgi:hypothetical protein
MSDLEGDSRLPICKAQGGISRGGIELPKIARADGLIPRARPPLAEGGLAACGAERIHELLI